MATNYRFTLGGQSSGSGQAPAPGLQRHSLFPTVIWQARLAALAGRLPGWIAEVEALRAASPSPAGRTNRGGWNSRDTAILDQPTFAQLAAAVRAHCRQALADMGLADAAFVLQSWINIHDPGGFNFLHMHEGALLSGSFYLQAPPGSGNLVFRDPRPGVINSFCKGAVANGYSDVQLKPDAGLLVLFPHWLEHYVEPHAGEGPRMVRLQRTAAVRRQAAASGRGGRGISDRRSSHRAANNSAIGASDR